MSVHADFTIPHVLPALQSCPQVVPNFRVRTIPVLGTTPAVFGMAAAGWSLCTLAGCPIQTAPIIKLQEKQVGWGWCI